MRMQEQILTEHENNWETIYGNINYGTQKIKFMSNRPTSIIAGIIEVM